MNHFVLSESIKHTMTSASDLAAYIYEKQGNAVIFGPYDKVEEAITDLNADDAANRISVFINVNGQSVAYRPPCIIENRTITGMKHLTDTLTTVLETLSEVNIFKTTLTDVEKFARESGPQETVDDVYYATGTVRATDEERIPAVRPDKVKAHLHAPTAE